MAGRKIIGRVIRFILGGVIFILIGWIGAPAGMAELKVALSEEPGRERLFLANRLVQSLRPANNGPIKLTRKQTEDGLKQVRACGYDPQSLLGNEDVPFRLSTEWGAEVLAVRSVRDARRVSANSDAEYLVGRIPPAAMAALTQCLTTTPAARLCHRYVRGLIEMRDDGSEKAQAETLSFLKEQDQAILCTYLDGAANRRGVAKLAPDAPTLASTAVAQDTVTSDTPDNIVAVDRVDLTDSQTTAEVMKAVE